MHLPNSGPHKKSLSFNQEPRGHVEQTGNCQRDHVSRHLINLCTALDDVQVQQPVLLDQPSLCLNVAKVPSHGAAARELCSSTTNNHISNVSNYSDELSASATGGACITLHLNSAGRLKKANMDVCKAVIVAPARVAAA